MYLLTIIVCNGPDVDPVKDYRYVPVYANSLVSLFQLADYVTRFQTHKFGINLKILKSYSATEQFNASRFVCAKKK